MKLYLIFFCIFALSVNVTKAIDTLGGCSTEQSKVLDANNEILAGCNSAEIALKTNSSGLENYQNSLNEKMAKLVAIQTKQILQDLGTSSDFYEQNDISFLMGAQTSEVANKCKFGFISELEKSGCDGKSITNAEKEKLKMIAKNLDENYRSTGLMDGLKHVYGSNKYGYGFDEPSKNQCPASGNAIAIKSQLTPRIAQEIISLIIEKKGLELNVLYSNIPQMNLIKSADISSPGFRQKFENYIKNFDSKNDKPVDYFSKFFFKEENKASLSKGIAARCEQVRSSISSFVCHPLKQMASLEPITSKKLFNNYNPNKDFQDQKEDVKKSPDAFKTFALLCLAKKEQSLATQVATSSAVEVASAEKANCLKLTPKDDTVDNWYRCFTDGIRTESLVADASVTENFCSMYSCKNEKVSNTKSCKSGGPLTSEDLASLDFKEDEIEKYISYLKSLEGHKKSSNFASEEGQDEVSPSLIKKNFSEFDLNAFGAEAVVKFEKLAATPATIALVNQEMKEKGIIPSTPEQVKEVINRGESVSENLPPANPNINMNLPNSFTEGSAPVVRENWKHTAPDVSDYVAKAPSANSRTLASVPEKTDEEKQMIEDLKKIMNAKKAESEKSSEEKVAAVSPAVDATSKINSPLDSWARNLKNKESALNERENFANLRDAEYWRRESELRNRENDLSNKDREDNSASSEKSAKTAATQNENRNPANKELSKSSLAKIKLENAAAEVSAGPTGLIVTPEKLDKLEKIDLKNFGVNIEEPFVISIKMNGKLIHVRVAKVAVKGKTFLAPRLNEDNKEVKEVILKSPLFKEFRYFYEKENSTYFPTASRI